MDFVKSKPGKKSTKKSSSSALLLKWVIIFIGLTGLLLFYFFSFSRQGRVNIALVGDSVSLISLDNESKTAVVVNMPENAYYQSTYGKGYVLNSSLLKLDIVSKKRGKLLISTLREFIGVPVDGWIKIEGKNPETKEDFLRIKNKTSFSFYSLKFFYQLGKIRPDKIDFINLEDANIFHNEQLPDNSEVLSTDTITMDGYLAEKFYELAILREGYTISVLNGSETSGLATRVARIIGNSGGHVIMVSESSVKTDRCTVSTTKEKKNSYTVKRYAKIFNCSILTDQTSTDSRSDLTITLGLDYKNELFGKK